MELTAQEYKIAEYVSRGYSEKEIADKLFVSQNTVHTHTYSIRKKWNARNAVDVARKFILSLDDPKRFFVALALVGLQTFLITTCPDTDLRRVRAQNRISRKIEA